MICDCRLEPTTTASGVGGGGAGGVSAPPKVLICRKFGQNLNEFGHKSFDIL